GRRRGGHFLGRAIYRTQWQTGLPFGAAHPRTLLCRSAARLGCAGVGLEDLDSSARRRWVAVSRFRRSATRIHNMIRSLPAIYICFPWLLSAVGCAATGAIAGKLMPPQTIPPKYVGLYGQSVGVMVWTDRGLQIDYPTLGLDLANSIDHKLRAQTV